MKWYFYTFCTSFVFRRTCDGEYYFSDAESDLWFDLWEVLLFMLVVSRKIKVFLLDQSFTRHYEQILSYDTLTESYISFDWLYCWK